MFNKPVETKKIMIEVVECPRHFSCWLRSGLIQTNPVSIAASKLQGTECAIVDKKTLIDTRNGGLEDDNEFIKAIASRPAWDRYRETSVGHGGRRETRDIAAEKYVARQVEFTRD